MKNELTLDEVEKFRKEIRDSYECNCNPKSKRPWVCLKHGMAGAGTDFIKDFKKLR